MKADFQIDSNQELSVVSDCPRTYGDPRSIALTVTTYGYTGSADEPGPSKREEHAVTLNLEPSHARAIASAILSAATKSA